MQSDSFCAMSLESTVGTFCRIYATCSGEINHGFAWTTGPLHNWLPWEFYLLGLNVQKFSFPFFEHIMHKVKRIDLQSAYVIPVVVNIWNRKKTSLVQEIKGTSCCIASNMCVYSPGHTDPFGSQSSLDVEKMFYWTQIIKILQTSLRTNLCMFILSCASSSIY